MPFIKWVYRAAFVFFTIVAVALISLYHSVTVPINADEKETFEVNKGDTFYSLGGALASEGWIDYAFLTRVVSKLNPTWTPKPGKYQITPEMSLIDIMALLDSGRSISYTVTFLEGKTTQDFIATMAAKENINMTLLGLSNEQIAEVLGLDTTHPEGLFFANTFRYHDGDSDVSILKHSHELLQNTLDELWEKRAKDLPYKSAYEALIMASIIEKETGVPEERGLISRVFISRLEKRMRLQTDPTVIYGLGDSFTGNLTRKGLRSDSPYNTYRVFGLPPTPIANVGREAIEAALNPSETTALYFVAKGDGTHTFSNTLREHNNAVRKYQFKRREDYRSTPQVTE